MIVVAVIFGGVPVVVGAVIHNTILMLVGLAMALACLAITLHNMADAGE